MTQRDRETPAFGKHEIEVASDVVGERIAVGQLLLAHEHVRDGMALGAGLP